MNNYVIIGLIVVLAAVLLLLLKMFVPAVRTALERMPKWVMFLLIAIVVVVLILLIRSLVKTGGTPGTEGETVVSKAQKDRVTTAEADLENCIVLRADTVYIKGRPVDSEGLATYLGTKAKEGTTITLVDDFALASLYRTVTNLCDEKGVNYNTQNENWLEEQ